jgi:acetamidase/formamidase
MEHRVGREHIHTYWSRELEPRVWVWPGDTVSFETLEASYGRVAREVAELAQGGIDPELVRLIEADSYPERSTSDRDPSIPRGHPLTGPVAVHGAEPGDTLVIHLVRIVPAQWGFTACHSDPDRLGLLNDMLDEETGSYHHFWDLRDGRDAEFRPGIRVPIAPFCGVMGVAPGEPGQHSTIPPRRSGGNLDLRHLTAGATLYLPVLAPDALLSVGDVHAAQGDGEVSGTGIETAAVVTVRLDLAKGTAAEQPRVVTSGEPLSIPGAYHVTAGIEPDLREAARSAIRGTIDYLVAERGLTRPEAYVLCSVAVDLKISQLVDMPNYTVSAYLPLSIFDQHTVVG